MLAVVPRVQEDQEHEGMENAMSECHDSSGKPSCLKEKKKTIYIDNRSCPCVAHNLAKRGPQNS